MAVIRATVLDSTHLELSSPITAGKGQTVLVSVEELSGQITDREQWISASASCLQGAYGDAEPDYLPSMIRESNPDYCE